MGIVLFRIDDRLIHGQVVEGWFHFLHPDRVIVADDEASRNTFQRSLMELVVPYEVKTEIVTVGEAVERALAGGYLKGKAIVLFRSPRGVCEAIRLGLDIDRLNLGGLHACGETTFLGKGVLASPEDVRDLELILESGVHIEVRPVPSEPGVDLRTLMPGH